MVKCNLTKWLIAFCCLLSVGAQASGQKAPASSSKIIEELTRLENDWLSTYISGDSAKFDRLVAEDFTGTDESATLRRKSDEKALLPTAKIPGGSAVNRRRWTRISVTFAWVSRWHIG